MSLRKVWLTGWLLTACSVMSLPAANRASLPVPANMNVACRGRFGVWEGIGCCGHAFITVY